MALTITALERRTDEDQLNTEWLVVENPTDGPISTRGCRVVLWKATSRKPIEVAKLDPGFVIPPGGKVRVVCGRPGTKAHGKAPEEEGVENYFLLQKVPMFRWKEGRVGIVKGQHSLAAADFPAG